MNKTCPVCGREFDNKDKRKRYCSEACAYRAKLNDNNRCNKLRRTADKRDWARHEAEVIMHNMIGRDVENLAEYIFNKFRKKQ